MPTDEPRERVVLVTGANGGLAAAIMPELARAGYRLVLTDLADCTAAAAALGDAVILRQSCDLESPAELGGFLERAAQAAEIDSVLNNAACMGLCPVEQLSPDVMRRFNRINVEAPLQIAQHLASGMRRRGFGRIVNIVSGTPWFPSPGMSAYLTSKMGLIGLTRALAHEFGGDGITVNAITPALTRHANNQDGLPDEVWTSVPMLQAIKRPGRPHDIAAGILFLMSEGAGFMTGQTLAMDGGMVLR